MEDAIMKETPSQYAHEKQREFNNILSAAYEREKIDEVNYRRLSLETLSSETWDEAFDHYQNLYRDFVRVMLEKEQGEVVKRMTIGAVMIDKEKDERKRIGFMRLYDELEKRHNEIKDLLG